MRKLLVVIKKSGSELNEGISASQYKDYIFVLLFILSLFIRNYSTTYDPVTLYNRFCNLFLPYSINNSFVESEFLIKI